jgi:ribosomal RNA assembly protein
MAEDAPDEETSHLAQTRIPEDRIGALIGKEGKSKRRLEKQSDCSLDIDSDTGEVTIESSSSVDVYFVQEVVNAVGNGFNPSTASLILKKDYLFESIDINNYVGEKRVKQMKGRVIGTNGKTRETIEDLTETYLSVYEQNVSIIGRVEHIQAARQAVEKLLNGQSHSAVYKALERHRDKVKRQRLVNTGGF